MQLLAGFDTAFFGALIAALGPALVCLAAGALIGTGPSRWSGADMMVGFGLFAAFVTVFAVTLRVPLSWLFAGFAVLAPAGVLVRRQFPGGAPTWLALVLLFPVIWRAAGSTAALWDEVWHWLPNAIYAYNHDSFAWPDLPPPVSRWPGYPQLIPLLIAEASLLAGRFLESAGPVINVLLLVGASALLADAMAATLIRHKHLDMIRRPVTVIAAAVVITVVLNPGLDGRIVLSSYADSATMVAIGALGLLGVEVLLRLSRKDAGHIEQMAWRFGLIGAMLVALKQANPILLALVILGWLVIVSRVPAIPKRRALAQLPRMLAPAIFVFLLWRWYVGAAHLGDAEMAFRPFADWNFDLTDEMFRAFGRIVAERPLFHGMMWLVTAAGTVAFFSLPRKSSEARWLAVLCAVVWLGYNAALIVVTWGAMSKVEAMNGADYWRYTPHVALLGLYVPVMALVGCRWPSWLPLRGKGPAIIAILLALFALQLRGSFDQPKDWAWLRFLRATVAEMAASIPAGSKVMIVPCWNESPFAVMVRYDLWQFGTPGQAVTATILWRYTVDLSKVADWAANGEVQYLVVQDGECSADELIALLKAPAVHSEIALLEWRSGTWDKVKAWPIPAGILQRWP